MSHAFSLGIHWIINPRATVILWLFFSHPVVSDSVTVSFKVQGPLSAQRNPTTLASGNTSSENESRDRRALD